MADVCYGIYDLYPEDCGSRSNKFLRAEFLREEDARDYLMLLQEAGRNQYFGFEIIRRTKVDEHDYLFESLVSVPMVGDAVSSPNGGSRARSKPHDDPAR